RLARGSGIVRRGVLTFSGTAFVSIGLHDQRGSNQRYGRNGQAQFVSFHGNSPRPSVCKLPALRVAWHSLQLQPACQTKEGEFARKSRIFQYFSVYTPISSAKLCSVLAMSVYATNFGNSAVWNPT